MFKRLLVVIAANIKHVGMSRTRDVQLSALRTQTPVEGGEQRGVELVHRAERLGRRLLSPRQWVYGHGAIPIKIPADFSFL